MKKKLLFLMAAFALFVPSVLAAEEPTYEESTKALFANGTPVTIEDRTDGVAGALVKWNGGEKLLPADNSVFGGSHDSATKLDSTSITMNGGTLNNIFGGGLHKSHVGTSTVVINGGTIKGGVQGGGASSYAKTTCHRPWYAGDRENAPTVVDNAIVTINGGKFYNVFGGGEGISYTKNVTLVVNDGEIAYLTNGGSNGFTDNGELEVNGGTIGVMQSVNRGDTKATETTVNGGTIKNLYAGGEDDSTVNGTISKVVLYVLGGNVDKLYTGKAGNHIATENDDFTVVYNEEVVKNVSLDGIKEENVNTTVTLTFKNGDNGESVVIPKGTTLTKEEIQELIDELNETLKDSNMKFVGFFKDSKFTTAFDFTKPINEDTTVFIKLKEAKNNTETKNDSKSEEKNPKTSDMNLALILASLGLASTGAVLVSRKKLAKANR